MADVLLCRKARALSQHLAHCMCAALWLQYTVFNTVTHVPTVCAWLCMHTAGQQSARRPTAPACTR